MSASQSEVLLLLLGSGRSTILSKPWRYGWFDMRNNGGDHMDAHGMFLSVSADKLLNLTVLRLIK